MRNSLIKKTILFCFSVVFVFSLIATPLSPLFEVKKAEALFGVGDIVLDPSNLAQTTISAAQSVTQTALSNSMFTKEFILDGVAWGLVNSMLEQMLQSTIQWVNSGFDGKPMFVTDVRGFLLDSADVVFDDFVNAQGLDFLCSPFRLESMLSLEINYVDNYRNYEPRCTLSGLLDNAQYYEDYVSGGFRAGGGWGSWYEVAMNPTNNAIGAMVETQNVLDNRIANVQETQNTEIDRNNGFLNHKNCGSAGCSIVLPGQAIQEQLNNALSSGQQRLTIADEIDELLAALFTQLVNEAFSATGLTGISSGGYFSPTNSNRTPPPSTIPEGAVADIPSTPTGQGWSVPSPNFIGFGFVSPTCDINDPESLESKSCRLDVYEKMVQDTVTQFTNISSYLSLCTVPDNSHSSEIIDDFYREVQEYISEEQERLDIIQTTPGIDYPAHAVVRYGTNAPLVVKGVIDDANSLPCE